MQVEAPNLSCEKCIALFRETQGDELPPCKTTKCPMGEDLAKDKFVNAFCNKFVMAKHLYKASGLPDVQIKAFEDLGLFDDPELHLHLEVLFYQGEELRAKEASKSHKSGGYQF